MIAVSIIIPIYNVEKYVGNCLKSVMSQTYQNFEVILVDDCGTDKSIDIVKSYIDDITNECERSKYIIVKHQKNRGLSAARNTGTLNAKGKYVYYLDSDDTITPDCLEFLVRIAEDMKAEVTLGDIRICGNDNLMHGLKLNVINNRDKCLIGNNEIFHSYLHDVFYMTAWNKLIRRDFLICNDLWFVEGLIHEDQAWSFSLACITNKIAFVYNKTYNYLVHEDSIQTDNNYNNHFDAYCYLIKYYVYEAQKYGKNDNPLFLYWLERKKALFFGTTMNKGNKQQLKHIYHIIRRNMPQGEWSKASIHYLLPEWLGILAYKKWHGMWLM